MYVHVKTIMTSFPKLTRLVRRADEMIEGAALASFSAPGTTEEQIERVCELIERKNLLVNLHVITKNALRALGEEDKLAIKAKYFKSKGDMSFSRRTYFRRVAEGLKRLNDEMKRHGLTKEYFERVYVKKISFLSVAYDFCKKKELETKRRASSLKLNKSFAKKLEGAAE